MVSSPPGQVVYGKVRPTMLVHLASVGASVWAMIDGGMVPAMNADWNGSRGQVAPIGSRGGVW